MSAPMANIYDNLCTSGILPYDVNQIVTGEPSAYLQSQPSVYSSGLQKDEFKSSAPKNKANINPKAAGFAALMTYITGAVLSKSTNPLKGMKAIGNLALKAIKLPLKLLKK